ncbi:hypothetical protein FRC00_011034, partial [Tulasnella sp. 408]
VDLEEFHRIACAAVGRDPPQKRTSDVMKRIWDLPTSPGVRCPKQQHQMTQDWDSRLAAVDGPRGTLQQKRPSRAATWASISPSPSPFRVLGQLSNVGLIPFTPKLLAFEKPQKLFYKDRKASLEHGIENDPEVARRSISPKTPVPSLVRLPASPSPTPPPPSASPPLKRRASSIDDAGTLERGSETFEATKASKNGDPRLFGNSSSTLAQQVQHGSANAGKPPHFAPFRQPCAQSISWSPQYAVHVRLARE